MANWLGNGIDTIVFVLIVILLTIWAWRWSLSHFKHYQFSSEADNHSVYRSFPWILCGLGLFILVAGIAGARLLGGHVLTHMRNNLTETVQGIATAINLEHVEGLRGRSEDLDTEEYQQIKFQLQSLRSANPSLRFVYLLRVVDKQSLFLADSEFVGSPDESPPGQVYSEAPTEVLQAFATGKVQATEIYQDRWGTWISGFYLLRDPTKGHGVAVLGIDLGAVNYHHAMMVDRLKAFFMAMVVGVATFFGLLCHVHVQEILIQRGPLDHSNRIWRWGPGMVVIFVGTAITIAIATEISQNEREYQITLFRQQATVRISALKATMAHALENLDGIRQFGQFSEKINRLSFERIVEPQARKNYVQAIEWIPRITLAEREQHEQQARQEGLENYTISDRDAKGKQFPSPARGEYFPVYYTVPLEQNRSAMGFDLASNPLRKATLQNACDKARPEATPPIRLVQESGEQRGILIFTPVYLGNEIPKTIEERRRQLRGFTVMVYRMGDLVQSALRNLNMDDYCLQIEDSTAAIDNNTLAVYLPESLRNTMDTRQSPDWQQETMRVILPLEVAGRNWQITVVPTPKCLARVNQQSFWWHLPIGLIPTILFALYINQLATRRYRAEAMIRARTTELAGEKERIGVTLRSIGDGVIVIDTQGRVTMMNMVAEQLTGWSEELAKGKEIEEIFHIVNVKTRKAVNNPVRQAIEEMRIVELASHTSLIDRNGIERQISDSAAPIRVSDGTLIGAVLVFRDVTDSYNAREQIQRLNERFVLATKTAGIGIWEWNIVSKDLQWDDEMYTLFGVDKHNCPNLFEAWARSVHLDDAGRLYDEVQTTLVGTKDLVTEFRIVDQVGEIRYIKAYARVERDSKGNPLRMIGVNYDITARKQTEEYLRTIMTMIQVGVLVSERDTGVITDANPIAAALIGKPSAEIIGQTWSKYIQRVDDSVINISPRNVEAGADFHLKTQGSAPLDIRLKQASARVQNKDYTVQSFLDISDLKRLLNEQHVNIETARHLLTLVNAESQRYVDISDDCTLFFESITSSCKAAGGDHYFVRNIPENANHAARTVISLKDQSGHEVNCILRSIATDMMHHTILADPNCPVLERQMVRLNNYLYASHMFGEDEFVTGITLEIDHATRMMHYVSAGHPPMVVIRQNKVFLLPRSGEPGHGLPMGILSDCAYTSGQWQLEEGDRVLLYTDGLTEMSVRRNGKRIEPEQFREIIENILLVTPNIAISRLVHEILGTISNLSHEVVIPGGASTGDDDVTIIGMEMESARDGCEMILWPHSSEDLGESIEKLHLNILDYLKAENFNNINAFKLRLMLEESLLNAWKHGNKESPGKPIQIRWRARNDFVFEVIDQGNGFDPDSIPDPRLERQRLAVSGRGIFMIKNACDAVRWRHGGRDIIASCYRKWNPNDLRKSSAAMLVPKWWSQHEVHA